MPPASQRRRQISRRALLWGLALAVACLAVLATGMGYIPISPSQVLGILGAKLLGWEDLIKGMEEVLSHVVWEVRLPRILTSAVVGAGLALAGVVFQGLLLNPLADPFTLGVSSGAAFGASLSLFLGLDFLGAYTICLLAFLGAVATLFAVLWLSSLDGQHSPTSLILSGVIVAAILSAGISFLKYLAEEQVSVIVFWLMGSFVGRSWLDAGFTALLSAGGLAVFIYHARDLNIMCLGDRAAGSLGVDTRRVRLTLLTAASLVTAACVSVSGIIGFVGLLVPHLMRFLVGPDHRLLLPASALAGAGLLLSADTITRAALPHEVPIGVLTALIGGPFFCYVFRRKQLGMRHG
ncbi:iron ABC transporter permease [Desulfocarbo indianensis]|nr:iron ABC transporter permease [Desulfocarbo indianensis]